MVNFLINRPIAVFVVTISVLILGILSFFEIPNSLMPDIPIPEINIQITYPNNSAREIETNVVRPLKNQLLQISNLKDIETETKDGIASLRLIFEFGTNTDYAFIETNEKVDGSINLLPKDIDRPKITKASANDIPVINLIISLKNGFDEKQFVELSDFTENVVKKRLEQLPNISLADINGQSQVEIIIEPITDKLQSIGIDKSTLINAVKQNNFELGDILINNGSYQYNFKFQSSLKTKEDIQNIYLNINGKLFRLIEFAKVSIKPKDERGIVYNNGKRSIVLSIIKQKDSRIYELKDDINKIVESFKKEYPDLEFSTNQDQTKLLKLTIDNLKSNLVTGIVLSIFIMFLFIQEIKSPLIIAVSIPISLMLCFLLMYIFGISINIISLSGLILGTGMMVDNSIIVIDNITQKIESGKKILPACIEGTNEVISPLFSSVLTTCSVFIPVLFLSGIAGALFYDQAISVTIGLFSSLIVTITLIPVIYKQIGQKKFGIERFFKFNLNTKRIEDYYEFSYDYFFNRKWILYLISIFFILLAILFAFTMKYSKLPSINQNEIVLKIDWNEDINLDENRNRINRVLNSIPNIETKFSEIGEQQYLLQKEKLRNISEASIYLKLKSVDDINKVKEIVKNRMRLSYPKSYFIFEPTKSIFQYLFKDNKSSLSAEVYSINSIDVPTVDKFKNIESLILEKESSSNIKLKQIITIQIDYEKLFLYGIEYNDLINELKSFFNQNKIDNLKTSQKFITIKLNNSPVVTQNEINNLFIKNKYGEFIPVNSLIKFKFANEYKSINANKNGEFLKFDIKDNFQKEEAIDRIRERFKNDNENNVRFSGVWFEIKELQDQMVIIIIVSILLLYFIMAAQFESLWQPLIILLEIPIDIGGSLFLLWLFGGSINIMSAIGIIVMSGIVINDSILKVHTINELRKNGLNIEHAIKVAGKMRLKSILMTSLTTILALTPFLFMADGLGAELQKPLALTVIGGMILGTFISIYFIPLIYYSFSKKFIS